MKNVTTILIGFLFLGATYAQTTINGFVTDKSGNPISGANVFLEGTYDGSSTTDEGSFSFDTSETGTQTLVISALAYETHYEMGEVAYFKDLNIVMIEAINQISAAMC